MSSSAQIDTKAETTKLLVMVGLIVLAPLYLAAYTFFAWHKHLIASLSPGAAIHLASASPAAPVYAAAKDALETLVAIALAVLIAIIVIRSVRQATHNKDVDMDNLTREKWPSYEDLEDAASPSGLRKMAHLVRRDLFPTALPAKKLRPNRLGADALDGYPLTMVGNFMGYYVEPNGDVSRDKPVWLDYEKSILIVGPARSGKNYYFLNSMIVDHVGPIVTTCVRADLVQATARARAAQGPVFILDPDHLISDEIFEIGKNLAVHPVTRVGWNVLDGCTNPLTVESRVNQILAGSSGSAKVGSTDNVSDFYGSQISPIIKCAFYHTAITQRTIADAVYLLTHWGRNPETQAFLESITESITDPFLASSIPPLPPLKAPAKLPRQPGQAVPKDAPPTNIDRDASPSRELSLDEQRIIAAWLTSIIPTYTESADQDTFKAFFTGFLTQSLQAFLTPSLQQLLDPSFGIPSLNVDNFLRANGTLFIVGNLETQKTVAPIIVGLISDLYQRAQSYASRQNPDNPRLQPPLGLYLDEVISLAPLPADLLTGLLTTGSGSGIRAVLVIQDRRLAAMKWGEAIATSIDGNIGALLLLPGIKDTQLIDQYTRLAGESYATWDSPDGDGIKQGGYRPILRPEDIRAIPKGRALLIITSHGPIAIEGVPFTERSWFKQSVAAASVH